MVENGEKRDEAQFNMSLVPTAIIFHVLTMIVAMLSEENQHFLVELLVHL